MCPFVLLQSFNSESDDAKNILTVNSGYKKYQKPSSENTFGKLIFQRRHHISAVSETWTSKEKLGYNEDAPSGFW